MPHRPHKPALYGNARSLRREMTPAEQILWKLLRNRRLTGFKFRRQQPIGPYIADFFCAAAGLIVELDGESHLGRAAADATRQAALEGMGYRVLRFHNGEVYDECDAVIEAVWVACSRGAATRTANRKTTETPSPLEGEGSERACASQAPRAGEG